MRWLQGVAGRGALDDDGPPHVKRNTNPTFGTAAQRTAATTMSGSPPPEERAKADAAARAQEQAEQAKLPYTWDQTIKDLDITIGIDAKYKGKDLDVKISRNALKVGIKGQEPFIDVGAVMCGHSDTADRHASAGRAPPRHPRRRLHMDPLAHDRRQGH
jgi:hypothetical protein